MSDSIRVVRRPRQAGPVRYRRLAIAGVIAATAIAVPTAALASGSGSPSGKPAPPQPPAAKASKSATARSHHAVPAPVKAFATRLGIRREPGPAGSRLGRGRAEPD